MRDWLFNLLILGKLMGINWRRLLDKLRYSSRLAMRYISGVYE